MIDQNIKNTCQLIKQTLSRVKRSLSLYDMQAQELAIAFTFLRRVDCIIGQYAEECYVFYSANRDKLSDKLLDEKLREISGGKTFYNVSGYTFTGMLNADLSVEVAINSYLQGFSDNVSYILDSMNFKQNLAVLLRQSRYLVDLFDFFSYINLSIAAVSNKRFIDLITSLASEGSRNSGLNPTPISISQLICECLFCKELCEGLIYDVPLDCTSIYDPVCGTGSLLAYAGEKAKELTGYEDVYLIGQEISPFSCAIANALILLTGNEYSFADDVNTLTKEDSKKREYNFIVGDLPIGLPWVPIKERVEVESLKKNGRFGKGLPSTNDSQFLFIQDIVSKMDCLGGRAAFITSGSVLNGGAVKSGESRIRRWLFESGLVETIIALPAGVLSPYSNIPVYLWILSCDEYSENVYWKQMEGKVRLIDATKLVPSGKLFVIDNAFISSVLSEYKSLENTTVTKIVNIEELGFYELNIEEKGKKKETIRISLDTNIHDFIEKERKPYAKGEIIIDFSSVEKGYSVDFNKFFKKSECQIESLAESSMNILSIIDELNVLSSRIERMEYLPNDDDVNTSWKEVPLHAAIELTQSGKKTSSIDVKSLPFISVATLRGESKDDTQYAYSSNLKLVSSSDVIFIKTGANAGEIFKGVDGLLSPTLAAVRCNNDNLIIPEYLYYLLKGYEKTFRSMASSTSIKSLNVKTLLDFKCLIPSIDEQRKIVSYLDDVVEKLNNVIKKLNSSNNIFASYRQTLIENVVRGKVILI